jgi:hypothetical protein
MPKRLLICEPYDCENCSLLGLDSQRISCNFQRSLLGYPNASLENFPRHSSCAFNRETFKSLDDKSLSLHKDGESVDPEEDYGPLGKPSYDKRDEPSLRSTVQKKY